MDSLATLRCRGRGEAKIMEHVHLCSMRTAHLSNAINNFSLDIEGNYLEIALGSNSRVCLAQGAGSTVTRISKYLFTGPFLLLIYTREVSFAHIALAANFQQIDVFCIDGLRNRRQRHHISGHIFSDMSITTCGSLYELPLLIDKR